MYRYGWLVVIGVVVLALLLVPGLPDALFALVFVGMIPYTTYTLPPLVMLAVYFVLLIVSLVAAARHIRSTLNPSLLEDKRRTKARAIVYKKTRNKRTKNTASSTRKRYQPIVQL